MMKKLIIGLFASSSIFVALPAFAATQAEVVAACAEAQGNECTIAVQAYIDSLPVAQRAAAARLLAASLAEAGAASPNKFVYTAALNDLRLRDDVAEAYFEINNLLAALDGDAPTFETAAFEAPGDVGQGFGPGNGASPN